MEKREILKKIFKVFLWLAKASVCAVIAFIVFMESSYILEIPVNNPEYWDWQLVLFALLSVLLLVASAICLFPKAKNKLFIALVVFFALYCSLPFLPTSIRKLASYELCYEDSQCPENSKVYIDHKLVMVNKKNSIKHCWVWDENGKYADIRSKKKCSSK